MRLKFLIKIIPVVMISSTVFTCCRKATNSDVQESPTIENDGGIIAFYSEKDGNAEIYFTAINSEGNKIGEDLRITNASGASLSPSLVSITNAYSVAWNDDRDNVGGNPEIYFAQIGCL